MSTCKNSCKLCNNLIISDNVSTVTVNGIDTLLIDIPLGTYMNGEKYCIVVAQTIPTGATINQPVAISIGGVTTTVYPLVNQCCQQITACAIRSRTRYATIVQTNATGGVFKALGGLSCYPNNQLASLPVATAPTTTEVALTPLRKTTTKKEGVTNE